MTSKPPDASAASGGDHRPPASVPSASPPADSTEWLLAGPPPRTLRDRWHELLPTLSRSALFDPGRRGLLALIVVAVIAAGVAGWSAWNARPRAEAAPEVTHAVPSMLTPMPASPSATEVVVAVSGRVRRPGLARLPAGARVDDAVRAAGGALPGTDLGTVNLARRLVDGEHIRVGAPPSAVPPVDGDTSDSGGPTSSDATGPGAADPMVNLNSATAEQLDTLPGVGPTTAKRILDFRAQHGSFRSVDQLKEVDGIGDGRFARLKDRVTV